MPNKPTIEPVQDGRIHIKKINWPFLQEGATSAEYSAALNYAILQGWLWRHESGPYVKFTPAGAEMFACATRLRQWPKASATVGNLAVKPGKRREAC